MFRTPHLRKATARKGSMLAVSLALVTTLAACSGSANANPQSSTAPADPQWKGLTFTIGQQNDGIVQLAEKSGAFASASYKIKWAQFDYGPPLVQAASSGQIDLGNVGDIPPITGAAKNLRFKIVSVQTPLDPSNADEDIIVPKNSPIQTLAELKGRTIAVPQGSSAHGLLLNAIQSVGLTTKDVKFVYLPPAAGQAAFSSGKVDAWSIWEPQVSLAVARGARVIAAGKPPLDYGTGFYVASTATLADPTRRAALADVLRRLGQAYKFGNDHLGIWTDIYVRNTGLDRSLVSKQIEKWRKRTSYVDPEQVSAEQKLADNFFAAGEISQKVNASQVVDNVLPTGFGVG